MIFIGIMIVIFIALVVVWYMLQKRSNAIKKQFTLEQISDVMTKDKNVVKTVKQARFLQGISFIAVLLILWTIFENYPNNYYVVLLVVMQLTTTARQYFLYLAWQRCAFLINDGE
ncbi:hypothetical protein NVV78_03620 [Pediococcus ethanolidurans]|uniref:hypothetical protein n=2 Tax=Pediococcus ethanolidurans TaxID=319653 RepID=UPI001C1E9A12|nr:hypothetical protein [Pediococcus ethanolidurans]MBU7555542.1 hypothetical protein [Pediococcus ethanolidurans]MBU7563598.1 hypothetical protein [Pediococcus ethanolidurans]MCT4398907.1 hypothetical protein [Pediococcus ethanolidurans]MCV3315040.1 hypothetical protein [Pediococcus ethanolidurans]MCV3322178.1 hypothetical protein [Pediococcus ethanolidurans]